MLRAALIRELQQAIEGVRPFMANDFSIEETKGQNKKPLLSVTYRFGHVPFRFLSSLPTSRDEENSPSYTNKYAFQCTMTPGSLAESESRGLSDKDELFIAFREWLRNVAEELHAGPLTREIEEQREQIDSILEELGRLPDGYLSRVEAETLTGRLTELEEKMAKQIQSQGETEERQAELIQTLHRDIDELKAQLHSLPKKGWVGSFMVRVRRWVKDPENKQLVQAGVEITKLLLPPPG